MTDAVTAAEVVRRMRVMPLRGAVIVIHGAGRRGCRLGAAVEQWAATLPAGNLDEAMQALRFPVRLPD